MEVLLGCFLQFSLISKIILCILNDSDNGFSLSLTMALVSKVHINSNLKDVHTESHKS